MREPSGLRSIWSFLKRTLRIEGRCLKNARDVKNRKGECFLSEEKIDKLIKRIEKMEIIVAMLKKQLEASSKP